MSKTQRIMMISVSMLLCLVLITSSVVSTTFAKYVSSGEASAGARVAKWGVQIEVAPTEKLPVDIQCVESDGKVMFVGATSDTDGMLRLGIGADYSDALSVKFSGTAEVKLRVAVAIDVTANCEAVEVSTGLVSEPTYFMPIACTFSAQDIYGVTKIETQRVSPAWSYATSKMGLESKVEGAYSIILKDKIDVMGEDGCIEKIFYPNEPIVFHPMKDGRANEEVSINEFRLGFEWPSNHTSVVDDYDYDKLADYLIDFMATSTYDIKYIIVIEQVR